MRITKISVKGLFGMFDHEIPLNQESRITIVHGPNGVGKSVLLNMIDSLFNYEFQFLKDIPFEEFCVELQEGAVADLKSYVNVVKSDDGRSISIMYTDVTETKFTPFKPLNIKPEQVNRAVKEAFPNHSKLQLQGRTFWLQDDLYVGLISADEQLVWPDFMSRRDFFGNYPELYSKIYGTDTVWFRHICDDINIDTISAQRLFERGTLESLSDWTDEDQPATRTFAFYDTIDLHFNSTFGEELWENSMQEVMLFLEILNERLLFKSASCPMVDNQHYKLVFNADDGREIPYSTLSSGEQHLMYLYFRLIFGFGYNMLSPVGPRLVIIDEPELSMNVVWQRNFLKDLQRIVELRKFDVLIATHSPEVIYDKWDWAVALGAKVDD